MKLTDYAILFTILAITLFILLNSRINYIAYVEHKNIVYNKAIDNAIDDGTCNLIEFDSNREIFLNKEVAVQHFYTSLYINFGIDSNSIKERQLRLYIPVILITDTDGFYIQYSDTYKKNNEVQLHTLWTEKIPYTYEDERYIYSFTLESFITIYNKQKNQIDKGDYHDLASFYPDSILVDNKRFEQERRNAIISSIETKMNYFINTHNKIAEQFGITYQFYLPQIEHSEWSRTIDDISMFVLFQGYPIGTKGINTYNRYAFGAARITKNKFYYIQLDEMEYKYYYHTSKCSLLKNKDKPFDTRKECALEGAFPCPACKP